MPERLRRGVGRNGSSTFLTATGPAPGPPPPCGVEKVLCRLRCITSTPKSPGRAMPTSAFMLAPSMYSMAPFLCRISATRTMLSSNTPSVFGLVTINAGDVFGHQVLQRCQIDAAAFRWT